MYHQPNHREAVEHLHFSIGDTGFKLIFGSILGIGIVAFISYLMDNQDISKSAAWPTTAGEVLEIGETGLGVPFIGSYIPIRCPYAKYTYKIGDKFFSGQKNAGPCLTYIRAWTYDPPEVVEPDESELKKIETAPAEMEHPRYKPVRVRYDKNNQSDSVLDPEVLQTAKCQLYTSIALIILGGGLLGGSILQGYAMAPRPGDPSLSLEAALAAQKRQRR